MEEQKLNFNIIYKRLEENQKEWDYIVKFTELAEHDKVRQLREILMEITEPEQRFTSST